MIGGRAHELFRGIGMLAPEEGGMADGPHAQAVRGGGETFVHGRAGVAILPAGEPHFHEFTVSQLAFQLGGDAVHRAFAADLQGVGHGLAEAAETGFLGTSERGKRHGGGMKNGDHLLKARKKTKFLQQGMLASGVNQGSSQTVLNSGFFTLSGLVYIMLLFHFPRSHFRNEVVRLPILALVLLISVPGYAAEEPPYYFGTLAGTSSVGDANGAGEAARFNGPVALVRDGQGNLYVADSGNHAVRKIDPTGMVTTLAGRAGDARTLDGHGSQARFSNVSGIALDGQGRLYVADRVVLRRISKEGNVTTVAGDPASTPFGLRRDGVGSEARFADLSYLSVLPNGTILAADSGVYRQITPEGVVTTRHDLSGMWAVAVDGSGAIYGMRDHVLVKYFPDGGQFALAGSAGLQGTSDGMGAAARFMGGTSGVAVDLQGNIYVVDADRIRMVTPFGQVTTLAGQSASLASWADGVGSAAVFDRPRGITVDATGTLFVADYGNNVIRKITYEGAVTTIAGLPPPLARGSSDGAGAAARFDGANHVAVTKDGVCYVSDTNNHVIRKISENGVVTTLAGKVGEAGLVDGLRTEARFDRPGAMTIDDQGMLYVVDNTNAIRKVAPDGRVTTFADAFVTQYQNLPAGYINYVTAYVNPLLGLDFSPAGELYASETRGNGPAGQQLWARALKFSADGSISVAMTGGPHSVFTGLAFDASGVLSICDPGYSIIWRTRDGESLGNVTLSGNGGFVARRIFQDASGQAFLVDGSSRVGRLLPSGEFDVLGGLPGVAGNHDGLGAMALFSGLSDVAVDGAGSLYLACGTTIRKGIKARAPTILTQPQAQTVAYGGNVQFSVSAAAVPAPTYQWFYGGAVIQGATGSTYGFTGATSVDAGNYSVTVTNELGVATSTPATLTVANVPSSGGGGNGAGGASSGGGGAPSLWFLSALAVLGWSRCAKMNAGLVCSL